MLSQLEWLLQQDVARAVLGCGKSEPLARGLKAKRLFPIILIGPGGLVNSITMVLEEVLPALNQTATGFPSLYDPLIPAK